MNINDVIKWFQTNEVDGETTEAIIKEIGMQEQMLRQLIMSAPISLVQELIEEKALLEEKK
jgi:hypothetical protein